MATKNVEDYSFKYSGVMTSAMQSLPLGNGYIGANAWLATDGQVHLLISKTDAWSELCRLLKVAHVAIKTNPCVFERGADFELNVANGILTITSGKNSLLVYVDAFAPCVRLSLKTEKAVDASVELINYRNKPIDPADDFSNCFMHGANSGIVESADVITLTKKRAVAQYHRNQESCYDFSLKNQDMECYIGKEKDPLLGLTFGVGLYSADMVADGNSLVATNSTSITASIFAETKFTESPVEFLDALDELYDKYGEPTQQSYKNHTKSWREFWKRAYVFVSGDDDAEQITKAFLYQRYMTRCADRATVAIKFNGSIFTADQMAGYPENYDARRWGAPYWFQNTRIPYWYLLNVGDYDSMLPMFDMYLNMLPISKARCEKYFGHAGILIPETVSHFGLYINNNFGYEDEKGVRASKGYKALRRGEAVNRFIRYHYNGMLELSYMMLKYLEKTNDTSRREQMLNFIEQTLLFFDRHFEQHEGKMYLNPVEALETWQMCVNDTPDVAGLKVVCERLSAMTDIPQSLKDLVSALIPVIPDLPMEERECGKIIAPCEIKIYPTPNNLENAELYPVFPFDMFGVGKGGLDIARRTYENRTYCLKGGWNQDPVDSALLGLEEESVQHLLRQTKMKDERALFPAFWGPNYDDTPDQDHGGMTIMCLMFMLLQTDGDEYTAFPAWPSKWDVSFRLPIKKGVYVCGEQINGKRTVKKETI